MNTAFYLFSNLFHIYSMFLLAKFIFDRKDTNKILEFCAFAVYYVVNSCAFLLWHNWLLNILSNLLPFFVITFIYKSSILKKIAASLGMCIITITCDAFIMTIPILLNISSIFFDLGFVSGIFVMTVMNFVTNLKRQHNEAYVELPPMYYISVIFVPLSSIIIGYFSTQTLNIISLISAVILLLINADVFYLYDTLTEMFSKKQENELIKNQNDAYLNQIKIMQETQLTIRCLKHDMDNHIIKMQDLLDKKEYSKLEEYLSDTKHSIDIDKKIVASGNEDVDSILNYKLMQIKTMGVKTECKVLVPDHLGISLFDINIVLGNLIDNAIEALRSVPDDEQKSLIINVDSKQGYIKIYIANSFDGIVKTDGKTKKSDNINHGLGLKSVSKAVEKYGGLLKTEVTDKLFESSAIMYEK